MLLLAYRLRRDGSEPDPRLDGRSGEWVEDAIDEAAVDEPASWFGVIRGGRER